VLCVLTLGIEKPAGLRSSNKCAAVTRKKRSPTVKSVPPQCHPARRQFVAVSRLSTPREDKLAVAGVESDPQRSDDRDRKDYADVAGRLLSGSVAAPDDEDAFRWPYVFTVQPRKLSGAAPRQKICEKAKP
jgi:hypothetical protein